jgi:UDP-glucose 4-epimerase
MVYNRKISMNPATNPFQGKNVLVTGGLGFIGSNIVNECVRQGAKVTVFDCLDPRSGGNMQNIQEVRADVSMVINDVRNLEAVCTHILNQDVVFNCAAYTSHPNSMREPYIDIDVNCKGVINILEAMRRFNPEGKLIHVGTSTQIGKMRVSPIDENHPEYPFDVYSANKSASEKYVLVYGHAYKMRTCVVRLANNFGPRSNIRTPDFGFMNYFIGLALQGKEISVFGDGSQLRNISFVEDTVAAMLTAALDAKSDSQVFFATADRQLSVAEVSKAIVEVVGGKVRFVEWPPERQAIEIGDAVIINEKIKRELGWKPCVDLREGLARTKEYFQPRLRLYLG